MSNNKFKCKTFQTPGVEIPANFPQDQTVQCLKIMKETPKKPNKAAILQIEYQIIKSSGFTKSTDLNLSENL